MRAAITDSSGVVTNVIMIDEDSDFTPDEGFTLIILDPNDVVDIGYTWANSAWTAPEPAEPETPVDPPLSIEEQLAELKAVVDMLVMNTLEG